jgi:hypothetical protein
MAKANITTKTGTKITVEGTPEEVSRVIAQIGVQESSAKTPYNRKQGVRKQKTTQKATPVNLVSSLIDGGFFRKSKDLAAIKTALEEMGHYYPVTSLSPTLLRLVRKRQLRRLKENKRWLYTGS